jgi:hypothetical protein
MTTQCPPLQATLPSRPTAPLGSEPVSLETTHAGCEAPVGVATVTPATPLHHLQPVVRNCEAPLVPLLPRLLWPVSCGSFRLPHTTPLLFTLLHHTTTPHYYTTLLHLHWLTAWRYKGMTQ